MPIIRECDPNEAYELVPMKPEPHGPPPTWLTAQCNGIPVHHFGPAARDQAERYLVDPAFRLACETRFIFDR